MTVRGGRVYVLTGAASGIGRATALQLARTRCWSDTSTRSNVGALEEVAEIARSKGATTVTLIADITDPDISSVIAGSAAQAFGRLDAVIAVAGNARRGSATNLTREALSDAVIEAHAFACIVAGCRPLLKASSDPRAVAVSSFVAHTFRSEIEPFAATAMGRAALETSVRLLSRELAADRNLRQCCFSRLDC